MLRRIVCGSSATCLAAAERALRCINSAISSSIIDAASTAASDTGFDAGGGHRWMGAALSPGVPLRLPRTAESARRWLLRCGDAV